MLELPRIRASEGELPKRAGGQFGSGVLKLPTTQVTINGFAVGDALLDSGSQLCLIDSRVYSVIAPNVDLMPPARLLSDSGHQLNAIGTCKLIVCTDGDRGAARLISLWCTT